jgi:exosortase/archaeosortase family protein
MKTPEIILKLRKRNETAFKLLKFLVKLNIFAIPLYIIILLDIQFYSAQLFTASAVAWLLQALGFNAVQAGTTITIPILNGHWSAVITNDCIAWKSILAFLALVFATDFSLRKKTFALVFIPVIYVINLARIWFMFFYVSTFDLAFYGIVHAVVWSWGLLLITLALWLLWMKINPKLFNS